MKPSHTYRRPYRLAPMLRRNDTYLQHLASVPLFAACSKKELGLVSRRAEHLSIDPGRVLTKEGAPGHEFFVILEGSATVHKGGKKVATLGSGDYFGELALLDRSPRNATVTATTALEVVVLGQREFSGLLDEVPGLAHKLLAGMARRLREADAKRVH